MSKTPGFVLPTSYSSQEELEKDLLRRSEEAGYVPFDFSTFTDTEIKHHGVKGMRWGVRRSDVSGIPRKTDREASKDAREFARAKQFYGQGAGTRRKLIKATVDGKSAKDPNYKKAFDTHLANQDSSKHAAKAKSERKRKDVSNSARRGVRGASHILRGNSQYASAATAIVVGGALYAHKAGIDKIILDKGKDAYSKANTHTKKKETTDWLRDQGINV